MSLKQKQVDQIEESSVGSVKDMDLDDPFLDPKELSTISVADLLDLVKGDAKKIYSSSKSSSAAFVAVLFIFDYFLCKNNHNERNEYKHEGTAR